jgi:predicted Zn-dependent peptidase
LIKTGVLNKKNEVNNNLEKAILGFKKHLKMLMDTPPTKAEVEMAKKISLSKFEQASAEAELQNLYISAALKMEYGVTFHNKLIQALEKVTPNDVQRVAKKYFTKPSVISVLTTKDVAKKSKSFLESRGDSQFYPL